MCEEPYAAASRLSMSLVAAMSISVSDVCTFSWGAPARLATPSTRTAAASQAVSL